MSAQLDNAEMRTLATIAKPVTTRDSSGFRADTVYMVIYRPRVAWRPTKGSQIMEQAVMSKRTAGIVRTRYARLVDETMKVRVAGNWHDIVAISVDEQRKWMEIHLERTITPVQITLTAGHGPS